MKKAFFIKSTGIALCIFAVLGLGLIWTPASLALPAWIAQSLTSTAGHFGLLLGGAGLLVAGRNRPIARYAEMALAALMGINASIGLIAGLTQPLHASLLWIPWHGALALGFIAGAMIVGTSWQGAPALRAARLMLLGSIAIALWDLQSSSPPITHATRAEMSPGISLGMAVLAVGVWLRLTMRASEPPIPLRDDQRITLIGGTVLLLTTFGAGLLGFGITVTKTESAIQDNLRISLQNRLGHAQRALDESRESLSLVAQRPRLMRLLELHNLRPLGAEERRELDEIVQNIKATTGVSGFVIKGLRGDLVASRGHMLMTAKFQHRLANDSRFAVILDDTPLLHGTLPLRRGDRRVGTLIAERPLHDIRRLFLDFTGLGETGSMGICAPSGPGRLQCMPSRTNGFKVIEIPMTIDGAPLPMYRAIQGQSGVAIMRDFQARRVMVAYSPFANTGLGMLCKIDVDELYVPIRRQFTWVSLLLIAMASVGLWLLRRLVTPLASKLLREIEERRQAEDKLRWLSRAVEQSPSAVYITDTQGRIEYVNPKFTQVTGYAAQEVIGQTPRVLASGLTSRATYEKLWQTIAAGDEWRGEMQNRKKSGALYWAAESLSAIKNSSGTITHYVAVEEDITERKLAEAVLRGEKRILDRVARGDTLEDVLTDVAALLEENMRDARVAILLSDESERLLTVVAAPHLVEKHRALMVDLPVTIGHTPCGEAAVCGTAVIADFAGDAKWSQFKSVAAEIGVRGCWSTPILSAQRRLLGTFAIFSTANRDRDAHDRELVERFTHLTGIAIERKRTETRLSYLAHYDGVTGVANRALFVEHLRLAMVHAERHGRMVGVLFLDLDRFKTINDTLGHEVGDMLLKIVATRLQSAVRAGDTVARLAGDEFTIALAGLRDADEAGRVTRRIQETFSKPIDLQGNRLVVAASIGVALYPSDDLSIDGLLKHADAAMYRAKDNGGNNFQFYSADMETRARERLALELNLRKAIENNEFVLHYQPQVEVNSGRIVGVEALLRWQQPERGLVPPAEFIPIAEESGLIVQIGEWVLRTACRQQCAWRAAGYDVRMAVNLSARQFERDDLASSVRNLLRETGMDPAALELELTESMLVKNPEKAIATLDALDQMGIGLGIDDFGTGYSSLGYLKRFPLDTLKIDRSFVRDLPHNADDRVIADAIIGLARSLGMEVVAEGVETVEQLEFLGRHGCNMIQGYLYSRPLPAEDIALLLRTPKTLPRAAHTTVVDAVP